jgi:polyhydroxyalkanoate synthase
MTISMWLLLSAACKHAPLAPSGAQCEDAENHMVETEDGASIHLHRHRASGPPVLVVHGISSNHRSWDLSPERSLAVALQAAGRDAWLLDLRGHGEAHVGVDGREQRSGWSIEDYGRYDIPAAISHIRAETGAEKVGYVGHSLGGMVAAIYNAIHGDEALSALVVVASPVEFSDPEPLLELARRVTRIAPVRVVPAPMVSRMGASLRDLPFHADELLWSASNLSGPAREEMMRAAVSPMSHHELAELSETLRSGHFPAADALPRLTVPLRVIAGRADRIAPVDRVLPYYTLAGSVEKDYILAGRASGFAHDYGHIDLVLGDDAPTEIYPLIVDWFIDR